MELNAEQKEQIELAKAARARIRGTQELFYMYLSQDLRPGEALEKAKAAMAVWEAYVDSEHIPFPDVEDDDSFGDFLKRLIPVGAAVVRVKRPDAEGSEDE
jgi:hypothetical protein